MLGKFKKKYTNPYFQKKRAFSIKIPTYSWRIKITVLLIFIGFSFLVWFFFFSTIFNIKTIIIEGAIKISANDIESLVWEQTNDIIWGRGVNIFLFNKKDLAEKINKKYNLNDLRIEKKMFSKINISFNEKQQSIIWFEADKYYYLDILGNIINEVNPLNISQKNIPFISNNGDNKIVEKKVNISHDKITFILNLFLEFKDKKHNFEIEKFIINNEENTIVLKVISGPIIYFNIKDDFSKQTSKLLIIIDQKIKDDFSKKTYIDLRYGDRVYYR
ncbi:hypothetical protein KKH16_01260 [Patescibacteria group bacterium]|nr:hypothetical protein [Patescibacteria group bacterium]MBU1870972.1 hypothetical protein [Patescibacteria group bacterium]